MFTIRKKEFKKGKYTITVYPRYFKDFKTPLYYSWILQDEPLVVIRKGDKNVFVRKNRDAIFSDVKKDVKKVLKSIKNVNQIIAINEGRYKGLELTNKEVDYVFDDEGIAIESTKPDINLMIDDIPSLNLDKLRTLDYCKKKMKVISKEEMLKKDFIQVVNTIEYCHITGSFKEFQKIFIKYEDIDEEENRKYVERHNKELEEARRMNSDSESSKGIKSVYFDHNVIRNGKRMYEEIPTFLYAHLDKNPFKELVFTKAKFRIIMYDEEMNLEVNKHKYINGFKLALKRKVIKF